MKKSFVLASLALVSCYAVGLITRLAVSVSIDSLNVPAVLGGIFACGLLLTVFTDYTRKPRFRVGGSHKAMRETARPTTSSAIDPATAWTYRTFSA
jgi:hypothetical protein